MEKMIQWETELKQAVGRALSEKKPVLLDFFNPGWIGCQQMDAVTYPDKKVINFISDNLIPLRVPSDGPTAADFKVKWTPALVMLDPEGNEHYRSVGFLPADEFIPWLLLSMATVHFELDRFPEAVQIFDRLLSDFPQSLSAPEAIFFRGVTGYKTTHEAKPLKEVYEKLQAQFPSSEWAKKALPYRLL